MSSVRVPNRKKETLIPIIEANIQKITTIYSDEWDAYKCLNELEKDMLFPEFVRNVTNYKPTEAAFPHDYDDGEGDDEADVPQIEQEAVEIHEEDYDDPGDGADASEYSESYHF
ncbi:uncharacterized protein MONOS_4773 [Monocercomonoides exilis]|uniref:uncharacterized protein n=1 Tax=Monocercomonoides exilis TaxID=2049356 RepID=UPI00355A1F82|nr:hypothetical protein MONOS_4773 [Monocercomonoides exilis]|eukprot:MONOS_4773.1-p1 / transcript=MONOS_4773.1 / gene=MONOS_4773 / organism=Monocercomonoides_exilis_PA203 / gene_product=unspecified product / transcript_product=unspecified product / location=Mono_scaffold00131:64405-65072(-) / protein_length=113 / sequence_SO=supercontig / SO=protein_coding / is_pseudo=false